MRVSTKTHAALNSIVVEHTQYAKVHALRIVIIGEAKSMIALQPAVVGMSSCIGLMQMVLFMMVDLVFGIWFETRMSLSLTGSRLKFIDVVAQSFDTTTCSCNQYACAQQTLRIKSLRSMIVDLFVVTNV